MSSITRNIRQGIGRLINPRQRARIAGVVWLAVFLCAGCYQRSLPTVTALQTPAQQTGETAYVAQDGTILYGGPGTGHEQIGMLNCGDAVLLLYGEGEWSRVCAGDRNGYVQNGNLSKSEVWPLMPSEFVQPRIVVKKDERKLNLFDGDRQYGSYPIALGWDPVGDKEKEGDGKTPEGTYFVCYRNPNSNFHLSLGVSYPDTEDAQRGLAAELIDQRTFERIKRSTDNGDWPPWDTALGGEIMIHGGGAQSDWTAGCIAVENEVMDVLWRMCPIGTAIEILP